MNCIELELDAGEVSVTDDHAFGVGVRIDFRADRQSASCLGVGDELDDDLMADQGATAPVHGDEGEQAVLDLVPLARAWREVAYANAQAGFLREPTQLQLPQPHAVAVAAPAVGGDGQLLGLSPSLSTFSPCDLSTGR